MAKNGPPVKAGETDIVAARREAAAKLHPLFEEARDEDGKPTRGVFHLYGIEAVINSDPNNAKLVAELRANPHARTLVTVAAARGNPDFPADLVSEFLAGDERSPVEKKWFAEVYLGGLAQIFKETGVGLIPPPNQPGIDLARAAWGVISYLSEDEKKKLGIAEEVARRQLATDLFSIANEQPVELTPAQRLYRWAEAEMQERAKQAAERRAKRGSVQTEDLAGNLPPAAEPETPKPAPAPTGPVIPDLAALMGGAEAKPTEAKPPAPKPQAPKTPAGKKAAAEQQEPAAPPPAEKAKGETKPAASAVDEENRKLMLAAIQKVAKENPDPVTRTAAAAFLLLKGEEATADEMKDFLTKRGLL